VIATLALAAPAVAAPVPLPGNPLTVHVGELGQLQAFRAGNANGIFYPADETTGDAGFFLAFPNAAPAELAGKVYGFSGQAGPHGLTAYTPVSQPPATGSGAPNDPLKQVTVYNVSVGATNYAQVTQTTTYVNGAQSFNVRWDVHNTSAAPLAFKALAAADFYFEGSDRGTGIYTDGPPRFIGGTNADTGFSGGFAEVLGDIQPWTAYQALAYGAGQNEVWGKVASAAAAPTATFDNTVVGEQVDNAGGVEWDQRVQSPLAPNATASFALTARNAIPSALQLTPTNAGSPKGVPIRITATAKDSEGRPYAGKTLRYQVTGVNPGTGSVAVNPDGTAVIVDPGTNAGADTVIVYLDLNGNGTRQPAEPQASALATFVDQVAPGCRVTVSGDRPGGGGAGKPLVIRVNCNEQATVRVTTSLVVRRRARASAAQRRKKTRTIKLKPVTAVVAAGRAAPISIKLPKGVRRTYAGKTVTAKLTIEARDTAGNLARKSISRKIKLAKLKRRRRG
jgi:hypothetical protein